eukprot:9709899-Lingulodinium_polyedra.AAC.1
MREERGSRTGSASTVADPTPTPDGSRRSQGSQTRAPLGGVAATPGADSSANDAPWATRPLPVP